MRYSTVLALWITLIFGSVEALSFPTDVKLTSGAILHKCSAVRWGSDYVVIKHAGGVDPIRFANIAPEQRSLIVAEHSKASSSAAQSPAAVEQPKSMHIEGQCYITTKGAGAYKMSEVRVMIFPAGVVTLFDTHTNRIDLPQPLKVTTTDADGKFAIDLNPAEGPWLAIAQGSRRVGGAIPWEMYEWRVPFDGTSPLMLTGQNCYGVQHELRIAE